MRPALRHQPADLFAVAAPIASSQRAAAKAINIEKANTMKSPATHSAKSKSVTSKRKNAPRTAPAAVNADSFQAQIEHSNPYLLEALLEEQWRRNVEARKRLGMRPNQDMLTAERPKGMSSADFAALLEEADAATLGFIAGLATMWGHTVGERRRPHGVGIFGDSLRQTSTAKTTGEKSKAKPTGARS